jgi:hypothetical protein
MSKAKAAASPQVNQSGQSSSFSGQSVPMISPQTAIYLLNDKIQKLEAIVKLHMDDIETKFGEHEAYVTDNIPDLDLINKALSDINTRLIDLEGLEGRISALESGNKPGSPVTSPPPATATPAKKKGTVKLADITPTPVVGTESSSGPGISFS